MPSAEVADASVIDSLVEKLACHGWVTAENLLSPQLVEGLLAVAVAREEAGTMRQAAVGRATTRKLDTVVRQASSSWILGDSEAERTFLHFAEELRLAVNRRLFLGLFEFEAQFLSYPPGGTYARHIDALKGERNRVVSLVCYLNPGWRSEDGGALALWASSDDDVLPVAEIVPSAGTTVLMLSEEIPHEARPAIRQRRAIAGWFRANPSSGSRIDPER